MAEIPGRRRSRLPWRHLRLLLGGPILLAVIVAAAFGDALAPHDPYQIDPGHILASPSADHPFGTDEIGRDILSRVIHGARISLSVTAAAVLIATAVGVSTGISASYLGGRVENLVMRTIDVFVCLPEIFIAILVMALLESSLETLILTIGLLYFPQFARVVHSVTASAKKRDHVVAAVSLGAGPIRIISREILPNIASVIIVQVSFILSFAMLLEAGLSFLGLGVMPPRPSWGQMVGSLKDYVFLNPWPIVFPSLALFLSVFAINMASDWLQDFLNPELPR